MSYDTHQKRLVLEALRESGECLSAAELAERLPEVGFSSVYRILSQAAGENLVAVTARGRTRFYSYLGGCQHHLHGSCVRCGALIHLDEETSSRISEILEEKGLSLECDCLIPCLCPACSRKEGR